ncbi:hypothetical protein L7F22_029281 [Adiantum nelumboides]|nr:hypothetical protein [Adiantum nelumboides]
MFGEGEKYTSFFMRKLILVSKENEGNANLGPSVSTQSHIHSMGDNMAYTPGPLSAFNTKVIIVTACLLLVLIFALVINIFTKWFLRRLVSPPSTYGDSPFMTNCGLKKGHLNSLPTVTYMCHITTCAHSSNQAELGVASNSSQCPICLIDFKDGERIRVLPKCEHGFHVSCIDTWLSKHSSCPTCRGDLMDTIIKTSS